jgi:hypothetical protein
MKYENPNINHSKDMANVKSFLKSRSKFKVKVRRSKIMASIERSYQSHKVYNRNI